MTIKRAWLLLIAVAVVMTPGIVAQSPGVPDARFDALATLTEAKMREYGVPGVAVGIVNGDAVTIRGFGVTSVENPQPIGEHTVFPIASISKTFAATAAMRLVEQGKLDLGRRFASTSRSSASRTKP